MSTNIAKPRTGGQACNCGCSDCTGQCCELECLVQPRFFCGQLLTDQDLSVLLDWVKGKTALSRYRHGWGVVCGLEVEYDAGADGAGHVSIQPGYALDCCGNDIIVCEKADFDLTGFCKPEQDPCGDQPAPRPNQQPAGGANVVFGGWSIPKSDVQAVDLFVRYDETAGEARTALARGGCAPAEACEYTRTREGFKFYAKKAEHCEDSAERPSLEWEQTYRTELRLLRQALAERYNAKDTRDSARKLGDWLKTNPLHSFGFVREWLCEIERGNMPPQENWFRDMVFWLVQDWRNRYFRCECAGCGPEAGVPLARVWLWRRWDEQRKQHCKVIYVNPYPPFRRPLRQDCWPAAPAHLSLAQFVWQPLEQVEAELRKMGLYNISPQRLDYKNLEHLYEQLSSEQLFISNWSVRSHETLFIYFTNDNCDRGRVVYFRTSSNYIGDRPAIENSAEALARAPDAPAPDVAALDPEHPSLDLRNLSGIGEAKAGRLRESGFNNLRDLADADAVAVKQALSSLRVNPPDEASSQAFIDEAKKRLSNLKAGSSSGGE